VSRLEDLRILGYHEIAVPRDRRSRTEFVIDSTVEAEAREVDRRGAAVIELDELAPPDRRLTRRGRRIFRRMVEDLIDLAT
jgi:hypothetical protein